MSTVLDRRTLGRTLTRLANASVAEVLAMVPTQVANTVATHRIGITGPPGVGKSSLGGRLAILRAASRRVGFLAIDPTSPRTGGAILGDRIRIDDLPGGADLYVRSLASRSAGDGLADNLPEMLEALEAAGFDEILVETVGVGQAEYAARHQVDTLLLVLHPESGDMVQAMKAGVMELADLYVINKSDLPGAPRFAAEINRVLHLASTTTRGWTPPVVLTSIGDEESVKKLSSEIERHRAWLNQSDVKASRQLARARYRLRNLIERAVAETVAALPATLFLKEFSEQYQEALRRLGEPMEIG
jgi:LAO/AO transport system kinase